MIRSRFAVAVAVVLVVPTLVPAAASTSNDATGAPTFYRDVLPVLQQSCQVCHRANGANLGGMVAPMSFTDYASTRPWAKSIARQVEARTMPPWHAAPEHHGTFVNERTLTDAEVATLVRWAGLGAPAGDPADAPPPLAWPDHGGWSIGEPDLVIDMGEDYLVADDVEDQYITFVTEITPEVLPEPRWVKAVEFRPGSAVVHHIIARPLGGIAPGNDPTVFPDGFGTLLEPGTKVSWQMHYHKEPGAGTAAMDRSSAALRFYPAGYTPEHPMLNDPLAKGDFEIPPGDPAYSATVSTKFERDSLLMGYTPHMHLRGKSARYVARYPDGTEEVLLWVPSYDFNWQTHYAYPPPGKRIPAGTELELTMTWDNSPENPANPDPTETVRFGQPTTAEMMFGFVSYADAEPGYIPEDTGFFDRDRRRRVDPERVRALVKERLGLDWDALDEEQRQEALQRLRAQRDGEGAASGR
ncbi:MAG TPA: alkyl hydroperoxide reductase [Thermoanaerobaculia bacterium]|nr:alkyl hydroperoxide reductase [Thermoanaerobaculia bacterium]